MSKLVLGLDCGLTVTKAVLFDEAGRAHATASARVPQEAPHPRWLERDVDALWAASAGAIRLAMQQAGAAPEDVAGVGVTAHGDGLYLLDREGRPARPGILSL